LLLLLPLLPLQELPLRPLVWLQLLGGHTWSNRFNR
jgi:hypothetical protein